MKTIHKTRNMKLCLGLYLFSKENTAASELPVELIQFNLKYEAIFLGCIPIAVSLGWRHEISSHIPTFYMSISHVIIWCRSFVQLPEKF